MRKTLTAAAFIALAQLSAGRADAQCKTRSVQKFANEIVERFSAKTLSALDTKRRSQIKLTIEHSLADDDDPQRFEVRRFSSLARLELWFKSREIDGMPGRYSRELSCARGVCRASMAGGLNHNSLYLKRITYGISKGCPYLKTIYIVDGD